MDEKASARPERIVTMVSEIVNCREEIFRVIWVVVVAGAAVSFLTNILSSYIWEKVNKITVIISSIVFALILGYCISYALKSYARNIHQIVHFEIILPFRNSSELEALNGSYYKILTELQHRVNDFFATKVPEVNKISKEWEQFIEINYSSLLIDKVPLLLQFLNDLAEFFVFDTLVNFTDRSMTGQANYQRFGWKRPVYTNKTFKGNEQILAFKINLIFRHLPDRVPQKLRFLNGINITRGERTGQKKDEFGFFEFTSKYEKIQFSISPFPIIMRQGSRDSQLVSRYCHNLEEDTITIKIPVAFEIDFKGLKIVKKEFRDIYARWLEDLIDYIQHNLNWQHCAQYDMEQMVVELLGREV